MKKAQVLYLFGISFILTNIIAYLDYDSGNLDYITEKWILVILMTVIFVVIPFLLLLVFRKSKHKIYISLLGFLPQLYLIYYLF